MVYSLVILYTVLSMLTSLIHPTDLITLPVFSPFIQRSITHQERPYCIINVDDRDTEHMAYTLTQYTQDR